MALSVDTKEVNIASRGVSSAREEFSIDAISEDKLSVWVVEVKGRKFTMGGQPMTKKEALETVQCIWATTPKDEIKVG